MFNNRYYEHFRKFWVPIYKKQYFKEKVKGNLKGIIDIKDNIYRNWNLTKEQKLEIIREIGIVE